MSSTIPVADSPLFFLDYDGTLAPIVDDPSAAYPHEEVPALLRELSEHYTVWIVTGRHLRDLPAFLDQELPAIGLHGAQEGIIGKRTESLLSEEAVSALDQLRGSVPPLDGLEVEDKEKSFAVHYRNVHNPAHVEDKLASWLDELPEVIEPIWGKKVLELRAKGLNKGAAVLRVMEKFPEHTPVYLGDDVTDEDAFEALGDSAITVKIGDGTTSARYTLEGVDEVVTYLKRYT